MFESSRTRLSQAIQWLSTFARDLGYDGTPSLGTKTRRPVLRAELDAWYARAYGLTRDELRYILDPVDVMGEDYPIGDFSRAKEQRDEEASANTAPAAWCWKPGTGWKPAI